RCYRDWSSDVCSSDLLGSNLAVPVRLLPGERRRGDLRGTRLSADARRIVAAQAARALAYGLGSVLIGVTLARRGLSDTAVGAVQIGRASCRAEGELTV